VLAVRGGGLDGELEEAQPAVRVAMQAAVSPTAIVRGGIVAP